MSGCTVIYELSEFKCFFMRSPKDEGSQLFKFHFPCYKGERWIYIISLESVTSIQKPINQPKVAYHQVSCLLHQYINEGKFAMTIKELDQLGQKTFCWFTILDNIKSLERYISGNLVKISSYKGFGTLQIFQLYSINSYLRQNYLNYKFKKGKCKHFFLSSKNIFINRKFLHK